MLLLSPPLILLLLPAKAQTGKSTGILQLAQEVLRTLHSRWLLIHAL